MKQQTKKLGLAKLPLAGLWFLLVGLVDAQEVSLEGESFVPLMQDKPYVHVLHEGRSVKVQRVQDPDYELKGYFAKTVRKCPPFCIHPMRVDPSVETIGEVEIFNFMENELRDGKGLLIDARTPSWFKKGTIPGSKNYPFTNLSKEPGSLELDDAFRDFGAKERGEVGFVDKTLESLGLSGSALLTEHWDFTQAKTLVLWCNGPSCGQSPRAIKGLLKAGYPAEKLRYYRGGMQMWQLWGLTTIVPNT